MREIGKYSLFAFMLLFVIGVIGITPEGYCKEFLQDDFEMAEATEGVADAELEAPLEAEVEEASDLEKELIEED